MLLWGTQHGCLHSDRMKNISFMYDRDDLVFINTTSYRIYAYFLKKNPPFRSLLMKKTLKEVPWCNGNYKQSFNSIINKSLQLNSWTTTQTEAAAKTRWGG